ncbi:MAG: GAF domain-containing sensor histidine kinase [Chloroflexota bacterium]|nr:GAF domain-containing sensor histidine kinase [Chloroflexota bacterium]
MNEQSILATFQQLNGLLEQERWSEYWQAGLQLFCGELSALAISLYLLEPSPEAAHKMTRSGQFTAPVLAYVEQWETSLANTSATLETTNELNMIEVVCSDAENSAAQTELWHVRIWVEQIVRGSITFVFSAQTKPSPADQVALYSLVQMWSGNALRAQYLRATRNQLERVNLLYQIAQSITGSLELKTVFSQTTELAAYVLNAEAATLFSIDEDRRELVFMVTKGTAAQALEEKRMPLDQGVAGWVAQHGEPLIVNDTSQSSLFTSAVDSQTGFTTHNILCVPLRVHDRTIGVLELLNKVTAGGFSADDAEWLAMMGQQIAIALENAQLFGREQTKVHELATLNKVSQAMNSELDVAVVLNTITQSVLEISAADRSELWLIDVRKQALRLFAGAGFGLERAVSLPLAPIHAGLAGWSVTYNRPVTVRCATLDWRHAPRVDYPELDQSSVAAVPLSYRGRVMGVIVVYSLAGQSFDGEKQAGLQTFANQAAIALQNAELYQNLRSEQERIIRAQEEVRHQLARELHDNTAQMLSLIIMNLDLTRRFLTQERYTKAQAEIDGIEELARQANREIRTLLFELRPVILESRGLVPALHAYHRQLQASLESTVHLEVRPFDFPLAMEGSSAVFSIIQEAVNNIRKHAKAGNIWIRLHTDSEQLYFAVEDDGVGFDFDATIDRYGELDSFGLLNMHERAGMFGGLLTVQSPRHTVGYGTLVSGHIPLARLLPNQPVGDALLNGLLA